MIKKKFWIYSSTGMLLFAAITLVVNVISSYTFMRLDLSSGKIYSLSKSSKKILKTLPDRIIIKAYFTQDLPQEFSANRNYIEDILAGYRAYSRGRLSYSFIDPLQKKDGRRETAMAGIPPVKFTQVRQDKYEVKEAYMGILFIYGDKKETIPFVRSVEGLEYDITSKIKKLLQPETKTIAFAVGSGEPGLSDFGRVAEMIHERFQTETVDFSKSTYVPEGISAVVVIGPQRKYTEKAILALDQLLMKGIPVAFLIDEFAINVQRFYATKIDNGLGELLQHYGIKMTKGLVLDPQSERISVRQQQGFFAVENIISYPYYPLVTDFERGNAITRAMDSVGLLFVSPVEIEKKEGLNYEVLMRSSKKSWVDKTPMYISPYQDYKVSADEIRGPFNLAVAVSPDTGKKDFTFKSLFAGKEGKEYNGIVRETARPGRIFIAGNSAIALREAALFMNLLDWLSQDEELIAIRSKGVSYRPLKQVSDTARSIVKYLAIFLLPVAVILYGVFRWRNRREKKSRLREIYA